MKNFQGLELPEALHKALSDLSFTTPTPIQAAAIPIAISGEDLVGCAQTGTGKTAAFCIPMISRLIADDKTAALILAPTRELAQQIADVVRDLTKYAPNLRGAVLVGGLSMQPQVRALRAGPRILIGTPGRVLDHVKRGTLRLQAANILVLDEVDRMLDIGFAPQLLEILKFLPTERQTLFFSATMPSEIERMAKKFSQNPKRVSVGDVNKPVELIRQRVLEIAGPDKVDALLEEINQSKGSVIVFARTQRRTDKLADQLEDYGLDVARIHGGRSQGQRNAAMSAFRAGDARVLVATDVAARGIDISSVSRVVNFDVPQMAEDYVHRIGRTGRAGAEGEAVTFVAPDERGLWKSIAGFLLKKKAAVPPMEKRARKASVGSVVQVAGEAVEAGDASAAPRADRPERKPFTERKREFRPREDRGGDRDRGFPRRDGNRAPKRFGAREDRASRFGFERNERSDRPERSDRRPSRFGGGGNDRDRGGFSPRRDDRSQRYGAKRPIPFAANEAGPSAPPNGRWRKDRNDSAAAPRAFEPRRTPEERKAYDDRQGLFQKKSSDRFEKPWQRKEGKPFGGRPFAGPKKRKVFGDRSRTAR